MKNPVDIRQLRDRYSLYLDRAGKVITPCWTVLARSLMDGVLYPRKSISAVIEKGALSVLYGSLLFLRIRLKGSKQYAFQEEKYLQPENLASALSLAVEEFRANRADIILSIPGEWVLVRTVELPVTVKENLVDVVAFELDRLTPFSADEAMYDFMITAEKDGRLYLTLIAARADLLKPYLEAIKEKDLSISAISVPISNLSILAGYLQGKPPEFCVSLDEGGYEGCALSPQGLMDRAFSGTFPNGNEAASLDRFREALEGRIEDYRERGIIPTVALFTEREFHVDLEQAVGIPVWRMTREDVKSHFKTDMETVSPAALGGVLSALWSGSKAYNLFRKGRMQRRKIPLTITFVLIFLVLAVMVPHVLMPLQIEQRRLLEIDRQVAERKDQVKKVEALKKEVESLEQEIAEIRVFKESRPMMLNIMKELTSVLPGSVWLTRARVTEETVDVEGYAQSATEILAKLEQSRLFKKVEFTSPTIRDTRMNADRFVIKMEIEGFEKKESLKPKDEKKK
jgi:Tfp pilus assembly protein PilN